MDVTLDQNFMVGWGTLMMINANLAQAKHRSGFGWGLASLILGPIATGLLMFCDPLPPDKN